MSNFLLIDGNNLAVRASFKHESLVNKQNIPSGVHFGVFNSLISLKKKFNDYQFLISWDGKSERRYNESLIGVQKGIIPSAYKANRQKDVLPKALLNFYSQSDFLKRAIGQLGIPQIQLSNYESDDVLASYGSMLEKDNNIIFVTSDQDYYQLLKDNVKIWDGMKKEMLTIDSFVKNFNIKPEQWVDVGALSGDIGDNIFSIPGWGEKTATKEIIKYGTYSNVISTYNKEYSELRNKYPDLCLNDNNENRERFKFLSEIKTDPNKATAKLKYPGIIWNMPYTGVAYAVEKENIKIQKTILSCLMFQERVNLAYSLKKIDSNIENLPNIIYGDKNKDKIIEYFNFFDIETLKVDIDIFFV